MSSATRRWTSAWPRGGRTQAHGPPAAQSTPPPPFDRPINGGVISLAELCDALRKRRAQTGQAISPEDVKRAIQKLAVLGGGYRVVMLGGQRFVLSVPSELSTDNTMVLQHCAGSGAAFATVPRVSAALRWDPARSARALQVGVGRGRVGWFCHH